MLGDEILRPMDRALNTRFKPLPHILKTSQGTPNPLLCRLAQSGELLVSKTSGVIENGIEVVNYGTRIGTKFHYVLSEDGLGFHEIQAPVNC